MILSIAWKNIWRNRTRSLIVIVSITLGLIGSLFSIAMMVGMSEERVKNIINNEISHIQIHHKKYHENRELKYTITNIEKITHTLDTTKSIKAYTTRSKATAMIRTAATGAGITVVGIDPDKEKKVTGISELISDSSGSYFNTKMRYPVVIGQKIAEKLKVHLRSKIIIQLQGTDGSITGGAFRVAGIFRSNNTMFEERNLFVQKSDLAKIVGIPQNATHEIAIILHDKENLSTTKKSLQSLFPDKEIKTWKKIQPDLALITDFMNLMMLLFMSIIMLALGFGIVNTMLMVVMERIKEIGMLMAIGMNKSRVFFMIMLETVFLSLTGGVIGMVLSYGLIAVFQTHGLNLSSVSKGLESFGYASYVYPALNNIFYFYITILMIFTGIIASIYPALKALKYNPVDALRTG